jgi:hypothetical protein
MLQRYLAPILLAEQSTHGGALLLASGVTGDVVGDGEEDEGMK